VGKRGGGRRETTRSPIRRSLYALNLHEVDRLSRIRLYGPGGRKRGEGGEDGNKPIALMCGGTTRGPAIPPARDETRKILSIEDIEHNMTASRREGGKEKKE